MTEELNEFSKNLQRKINKKIKRFQHMLEKDANISICDNPTKNIVICNAGLVNGLTEDTVLNAFMPYGNIENLVLMPGKSYGFITFQNKNIAEKAYNAINGKLNLAQYNKPLYLAFTETVPKLENSEPSKDLPPGLILIENFVNESEENILLSCIKFDNNTSSNNLKHRKVKHYGYEFKYGINNVDKKSPLPNRIPEECDFIFERFQERRCGFPSFIPEQLTVNEYQPGQGIPPHVDTHSAFEDPILVVSLCSSVSVDFQKNDNNVSVILPRRSLLIMSGESRFAWSHGITPRKFDVIPTERNLSVRERGVRISFTFREIRKSGCKCAYPEHCDSQLKKTVIGNKKAVELEFKHVHKVYENIASHFSNTRHKPWPNVLDFVCSFPVGSILFDIGCGNGKYLNSNKNIFAVGCDYSKGLTNICRQRGFEVFNCDCLNLPIRNEIADGVICIAVIHHLANYSRRLQAVQEMVRILKTGGQALIYVWANNQQVDKKSSYLKQDRKNRKDDELIPQSSNVSTVTVGNDITLPVHVNRTQFVHQDLLVPWKTHNSDSDVFLRYYHVFENNEIEEMCKSIENLEIIKYYYDQGNWCIMFQKK